MKKIFLLTSLQWSLSICFLSISIAAVVRETYFFIRIIQSFSPNYNWENGVKQIKITDKNLSQSCILCELLRTKTLALGSKCMKHFFYFCRYFSCFRWVDEWMWFYLTCLVFLKSPWWLVSIFCALTPLT